jgi:hypothetical protein
MSTWTTGLAMVITLVAIPATAETQPKRGAPSSELPHVRSRHQPLRALIARGIEQSPTFRRLVETIEASDGIVYIEPGVCKHGVRACLVQVASAGGRRFLFVKVDITKADRALIGSIGHELQHAVEVLTNPAVKDYSDLYFFYKSNRDRGAFSSPAFETRAAIEAGETVADEIGRYGSKAGK